MIKTANVIILTPDGKVILQLRDDKPGISCPGQITAFGGSCENNEEPIEAAKREMREELGLNQFKEGLPDAVKRVAKDELACANDWFYALD